MDVCNCRQLLCALVYARHEVGWSFFRRAARISDSTQLKRSQPYFSRQCILSNPIRSQLLL